MSGTDFFALLVIFGTLAFAVGALGLFLAEAPRLKGWGEVKADLCHLLRRLRRQ